MIEKLTTLFGSFVTWLVLGQGVLTVVVAEAATYADVPVVAKVLPVATAVLTAITVAIKVVGKVTQVPESVQGLSAQHPLDVAWAIADEYDIDSDFWDRVEVVEPDDE